MEKVENIPHIPLTITDEINRGAIEILKHIRPEWNPETIEFKLLTDGITNKLVGCKAKDEELSATVLIRVYGNKTDLLIDRKAETRNIILLSKLGLAPNLYATFQNGLAYQFIPGCTLTDQTVKQKDIYPLIAVRMAKLHKVQIENNNVNISSQPFIWDKMQNFLDLVPEVFSDSNKHERFISMGFSKQQIHNEIEFLHKVLANLNSPVVFCHNDLLLGNVIYTKEANSVTFIDYEYAAMNYQAFDIANHFSEFAGVDNVDYSKYPDKEFQLNWFRIYLNEFNNGSCTSDDLETLYNQVEHFTLCSHIFWGLWAFIQAEHSYIDFDFLGYAKIRLDEYYRRKVLLNKL